MKVKENTLLAVGMIAIAVMTRLIPHYPNFTAVGAVALFGGAYLSKRLAFIIPIAALFLSDIFLNNVIYAKQFPEFYDGFTLLGSHSLPVYGAFIVVILLGMKLIKKANVKNVLGTAVLAACVFFLITNFASWLSSPMYTKDFAGLLTCYTAGIPFFWSTMLGNVFFASILFGGYELVTYWRMKSAKVA